jgi:Fe-S-cluster containining protein
MERRRPFSYQCNKCGRCCHGQVITLSPYDVIRIARAARISTGEAIARFTRRRGSLLRFEPGGECSALAGTHCIVHAGRPLACRLYPLGLERDPGGTERYIRLSPAEGSLGAYGDDGTVGDFLAGQGVDEYSRGNRRYAALLSDFRDRVAELTDFEVVEPREFWRIAVREALAEANFDANPLIDALFDPDSLGCDAKCEAAIIDAHVNEMKLLIQRASDPARLAAAAIMLAVSLGYSPAEVISPTLAKASLRAALRF